MPGGFEVGSISARFGIDNKELIGGLNKALKAGKEFKKDFEKQTTAKKLKVDVAGFKNQLKEAARTVKSFVLNATKQLSRVSLRVSVKAFVSSLGVAATAIRGFSRFAAKAFRVITTPIRLLNNFLTKSIFNLKNLIIVIAAFQLIKRAKEVETISNGFRNLTRGIGELSDVMLSKLRAATKGTISDLELMRTTNNAILLGVARSADEFAELANAARRLGRAVGRNTVDALNDLAIGIGRQSRLILDNLGLIVKVGKANEDYARRLNKSTKELTDAEKRQAFFAATMDAVRSRLAELGPDIDTTADKWDQLGAAISNTISVIAKSIVGGQIPAALAKFLNESRQQIVAFTETVERALTEIYNRVIKFLKDLFAGEIDIRALIITFIKNIFLTASIYIIKGFEALAPVIIESLKRMLAKVWASVSTWFSDTLSDRVLRLNQIIGDLFGRDLELGFLKQRVDTLWNEITNLWNKATGSMKEDAKGLRLEVLSLNTGLVNLIKNEAAWEDPARLKNVIEGYIKLRQKVGELNEQFEMLGGQAGSKVVSESVREAAGRALEEASSEVSKLWEGFGDAIKTRDLNDNAGEAGGEAGFSFFNSFWKAASKTSGLVDRLLSFHSFRVRDPLYDFEPLLTHRVIQPLANAINWVERFTRSLSIDSESKLIRESSIAMRYFLKQVIGAVGAVNKLAVSIQKAFAPKFLDPEAFSKLLEPFIKKTADLELRADLVGLSEAEAEVKRFELAIKSVKDELSKEQMGEATKALERLAKAAKLLEIKQKNIESIKSLADSIATPLADGLLGGIVDAFQRGESLSKSWAKISADIFSDYMQRAIRKISDALSKALTELFKGAGWAAGLGGIASGLIGIGSLIASQLSATKTSTVEDFSEAINSSEALRGVVAGPTNVAISKVGDSLSQALRTTEILLERIATAVETGGYGSPAPAGGSIHSNAALPLTTSSAT